MEILIVLGIIFLLFVGFIIIGLFGWVLSLGFKVLGWVVDAAIAGVFFLTLFGGFIALIIAMVYYFSSH